MKGEQAIRAKKYEGQVEWRTETKIYNLKWSFKLLSDQALLLPSNHYISLGKILWIKVDLIVICKSFNRVRFQVNDQKSSNKAHS